MKKEGWRLVHTSPLTQTFYFERYRGRRRVAATILTAKTERSAWSHVKKLWRREVR